VRVHVGDVPVDLLTATAHKINGPKGMGLLFVREGTSLHPLIHGGSQERAIRPGTEDIAGAVGLAKAVRLAVEEQAEKALRLEGIRDDLEEGLRGTIPGLRVNCAKAKRACHVSSLGIPNVSDASGLLMALDLEGIAVSGGSACHSGSGKGSHVIGALYGEDDPMATVRLSFGLGTSEADVERALEVLPRVVTRMTAGA
jgi:cysteine desulfurase